MKQGTFRERRTPLVETGWFHKSSVVFCPDSEVMRCSATQISEQGG